VTASNYVLSPQQEHAWRLGPAGDELAARTQVAVEIGRDLDATTVQQRLTDAVARHEILRTTYALPAGMRLAVQAVHDELPASVVTATAPLPDVLASEQALPIAPGSSPVRVVLVEGDRRHLVLTLPSLSIDLPSAFALAAELTGGAVEVSEPLQYADYAQWQRDLAGGDTAEKGAAVWAEVAGTFAPRLPFEATDVPLAGGGAHAPLPLDSATIDAAAALASTVGTAPEHVALATWYAWLSRASTDTDVVTTVAVDGRIHDDLVGALGSFSRHVTVRADLDADPTFAELVQQVGARHHRAVEWQDLAPMPADTDPARRHAFVALAPPPGTVHAAAGHDSFSLELRWLGDRAELVADAAAFPPGTAERFAAHLAAMLAHGATAPDTRVSALRTCAPDDEVAFGAADGERTALGDDTLLDLFRAQAARTPDRVAVGCGADRLTYAQLDAQANALAHLLAGRGVGRGDSVAVVVDRSPALLVAVLGTLAAGAAYVPLNADHPEARLLHQVEESGASTVVADEALAASLPAALVDRALILEREAQALAAQPTSPPGSAPGLGDRAYILYTSGSTGTPKGVAVTHANLVNYARHLASVLTTATGGDELRCGVISAIATDLGNTCIFPPLTFGGTVELVPAAVAMDPFAFADHVAVHPQDVLKVTPSHLEALLVAGAERVLPGKVLITGGEAMTWDLVATVRAAGGSRVLLNHYGPTETTIGSCVFPITDGPGPWRPAVVPIGTPIANTACHVVDAAGQRVAVGIPGELWIGGAGVASGYVDQPELSEERFGADPFRPGERRYRTGDLVRRLPDGVLEFLGRTDDQVKIRGYRVEPKEIEQLLSALSEVRQVAVLAREDAKGDRRLVAYVVADGRPAVDDLRRGLAAQVPEHMIPSAFVFLDALPFTPSGKIDRRALPEPEAVDESGRHHVAPRTAVEQTMAAIWQDVLGVERVGVEDDFFQLGGHSLLAAQVVARVRAAFGVDLPLHSLFLTPTIRLLAVDVEQLQLEGVEDESLDDILLALEGLTPEEAQRLLDEAGGTS